MIQDTDILDDGMIAEHDIKVCKACIEFIDAERKELVDRRDQMRDGRKRKIRKKIGGNWKLRHETVNVIRKIEEGEELKLPELRRLKACYGALKDMFTIDSAVFLDREDELGEMIVEAQEEARLKNLVEKGQPHIPEAHGWKPFALDKDEELISEGQQGGIKIQTIRMKRPSAEQLKKEDDDFRKGQEKPGRRGNQGKNTADQILTELGIV